jgi:hypothetical protein
MDKAEIEKILEELVDNTQDDCTLPKESMIDTATSSLTALIIKWLEGKKIANYFERNQLITELIGEVKCQ